MLTCSDDKTIKLYSLGQDRRFLRSYNGHSNWVRSAVFAGDGMGLLASGSDDKTVRVWDATSGVCLNTFYEHNEAVYVVRATSDGRAIASGGRDNKINIWDARSPRATMNLLQHYDSHTGPVTSLSFHTSGNYLISGSEDASLRIWDLREGHLLYTLHGHKQGVKACAFSTGGSHFASAGTDNTILIWKSNFDEILGRDPRDLFDHQKRVQEASVAIAASEVKETEAKDAPAPVSEQAPETSTSAGSIETAPEQAHPPTAATTTDTTTNTTPAPVSLQEPSAASILESTIPVSPKSPAAAPSARVAHKAPTPVQSPRTASATSNHTAGIGAHTGLQNKSQKTTTFAGIDASAAHKPAHLRTSGAKTSVRAAHPPPVPGSSAAGGADTGVSQDPVSLLESEPTIPMALHYIVTQLEKMNERLGSLESRMSHVETAFSHQLSVGIRAAEAASEARTTAKTVLHKTS